MRVNCITTMGMTVKYKLASGSAASPWLASVRWQRHECWLIIQQPCLGDLRHLHQQQIACMGWPRQLKHHAVYLSVVCGHSLWQCCWRVWHLDVPTVCHTQCVQAPKKVTLQGIVCLEFTPVLRTQAVPWSVSGRLYSHGGQLAHFD